jgi:ADP-ribose pyrophosphatase
MNSKWKNLSSEIVYQDKWVKVFKNILSNSENKKRDFFYVSLNTFVKVIAVNSQNEIAVIENFRQILQKSFLEIPAGIIEPKEKILDAGARELKEETGLIAKDLKLIGEFYTTNGISDQKGYAVLATNLSSGKIHLDEFEEIEPVKFYSIAEIKNLIAKNFITDGPSLIALSIYFAQNGL